MSTPPDATDIQTLEDRYYAAWEALRARERALAAQYPYGRDYFTYERAKADDVERQTLAAAFVACRKALHAARTARRAAKGGGS